ncbi:HpcH/HpaI aldolase/citrate lyase family protein [Sphingomonas sp.]|uniref:HpcH/HpaI aldolase/citrate lyase family protein n=1 Tax=Sphingomonas sp. TaxID=28214 RepID=UPI0035BBF2D3
MIRPIRSALYMPASNARAIDKARDLPCDAVILDLEDAVAPDEKPRAREAAVQAAREGGFGERTLVVRVNALDTEWGADDISAVAGAGFDAVLAPKVDGPDDVHAYAALLGGRCDLWIMIETCRSVFALEPLAACAQDMALTTFVLGTNDLAKAMRARLTPERAPFLPFLAHAVAAARIHGLAVLDGVYNAIDDAAGFAAACAQSVEYGCDGRTLIHPSQIAACNAAFSPNEAEIAQARAIVAAFDLPANRDRGAVRVNGAMAERLHLDQARLTLALAER